MAVSEGSGGRTEAGRPGSAGRDLSGLPLLAVSAAFFAAATAVAARGGSAAGLPLWFPLAVCGGISAAGAGALLLFSGEDATPTPAAPAPAPTPGRSPATQASEADSSAPTLPIAATPSWEPEAGAATAPSDPLLLPADRYAVPAEPALLTGELPGEPLDEPGAPASGPSSAPTWGPERLDLADGATSRGVTEVPAPSVPSGAAGVSAGRRTPSDPVHMNLGEFVQALQARVAPPRSGGSAPDPAVVPPPAGASSAAGASGASARSPDPSHPRCAECGAAVPAYPAPGRCPACGRPMCGSCQVASVNSGAFGRCRDCRGVPAPVATPA